MAHIASALYGVERAWRPCGQTSTWWSLGDTLAHKVGKRFGMHLHIGSGEKEPKKGTDCPRQMSEFGFDGIWVGQGAS